MTKPRILIVEDEITIAVIIKEMLAVNRYCLTDFAATGEEAIEIAFKTLPDLILMDIRLSGKMDGIIAYEQIKKTVDIPVIFISAYAEEEKIARASICNPSGYIVKPFKLDQLIKEVEKALVRHKSPQYKVG
jgi:CheY-like chemotaxis protein